MPTYLYANDIRRRVLEEWLFIITMVNKPAASLPTGKVEKHRMTEKYQLSCFSL